MPTPRQGYRLQDGTKVPGTTTIISRFKDSGALMHWAFKQGQSGKSHLYEETDKAADIGTAVHEAVELYLYDKDYTAPIRELPPEDQAKAESGFHAFLSWYSMNKVEIVEQEMQLVSEQYRYGGTPDAIGSIGGGLCLLDWKTSNAVYSDYLIQLAAYKNLWEENNPDRPLTGGYHLCRFSKNHGDFSHHYYPNLDEAWTQFTLLRQAYDIDKQLKERTK